MNKILLGAIGIVAMGLSAPASAADMAARPYTKAPAPMVATIYDWSGFYIGINGGGGTSRKCWDFVTPVTGVLVGEGCHNAVGGTVGGQVGYRWQSTNWVFGLEGQGNWADFSGENISGATGLRDRSKINAFGLFTGQVGYAWNNVLLYVKRRRRRSLPELRSRHRSRIRPGQRIPLGRHCGRRRRVRIRAELVGRLRVQSHLPRRPHPQLHRVWQLRNRSAWGRYTLRAYQPGRRYGSHPRELPLGWSAHRKVLIPA